MMHIKVAYIAVLVGFFGLLTLHLFWHTVLIPPASLPVSIALAIALFPLLLPLRGLLHGRPKSIIWAAYLSLAYFIHGVLSVAGEKVERIPASLEIIFSLTLFFAAVYYVRNLAKSSAEKTQSA
ncbi:MAG: DUF2069 domain-containing protein [Methylococcales bacterium]